MTELCEGQRLRIRYHGPGRAGQGSDTGRMRNLVLRVANSWYYWERIWTKKQHFHVPRRSAIRPHRTEKNASLVIDIAHYHDGGRYSEAFRPEIM